MTAPSLVDPCLAQIGPDLAAEPVRADRRPDRRQEQNLEVLAESEEWPYKSHVELHPEQGAFPDRHVAVLGPLTPVDEQSALGSIDVSDPESNELASPQGARVEDLQDEREFAIRVVS